MAIVKNANNRVDAADPCPTSMKSTNHCLAYTDIEAVSLEFVVSTYNRSKTLKASNVLNIIAITKVGLINGKVIFQNTFHELTPSILVDS